MKKRSNHVPDMPKPPPPPPPPRKSMRAADRQNSEVEKAFNRCLADVAQYSDILQKVCNPAGRVEVKGNTYAVTVEIRKVHGEKEKE